MEDYNIMTLTGKGQVTALTDIATLRLGVQTTGIDLTEIQEDNARQSQAIIESLKQLGITDIQTFEYNISKLYEYENNKRIDKGYSVRNILKIRMDDTDLVGEAIDTAVYHGANVVDFISFEVSNPSTYYQQALNLAILDATEKAKSIADELCIIVDLIPIRIEENSIQPTPSRLFSLREGEASTPIESGSEQIVATVTVEFVY